MARISLLAPQYAHILYKSCFCRGKNLPCHPGFSKIIVCNQQNHICNFLMQALFSSFLHQMFEVHFCPCWKKAYKFVMPILVVTTKKINNFPSQGFFLNPLTRLFPPNSDLWYDTFHSLLKEARFPWYGQPFLRNMWKLGFSFLMLAGGGGMISEPDHQIMFPISCKWSHPPASPPALNQPRKLLIPRLIFLGPVFGLAIGQWHSPKGIQSPTKILP